MEVCWKPGSGVVVWQQCLPGKGTPRHCQRLLDEGGGECVWGGGGWCRPSSLIKQLKTLALQVTWRHYGWVSAFLLILVWVVSCQLTVLLILLLIIIYYYWAYYWWDCIISGGTVRYRTSLVVWSRNDGEHLHQHSRRTQGLNNLTPQGSSFSILSLSLSLSRRPRWQEFSVFFLLCLLKKKSLFALN